MGHTVVQGVIQSLSVSQIATADTEQFGGCLRKWALEKIWDHKTKETKNQALGTACHSQLEHYLATGDDVLGKITRAGKHLLPAPGLDLRLEWGLNNKPKPPGVNYFPAHESLLTASGVPLIGFIDVINFRGQYVDPSGALIQDPPGTVEVIDHKTTSRVKYIKTAEQLMATVQMPGYGEFIRRLVSWVRFVRLSHIAYLTDGAPMARKVTKLVPVEEFPKRWAEIEAGTVAKMKSVAGAKRAEDIPGHGDSCEAFRGCPHSAYCPKTNRTEKSNAITRMRMSFIKKAIAAGSAGVPAAPAAPAAVPAGLPPPPGIPVPPGAVQAVAGAVPTPPTPQAAPVAVTYACQAAQGQPYTVNGVNTIFTCNTNGMFSFAPIAGGAPILAPPAHVIIPGHTVVAPPPPPPSAAASAVAAVNEASAPAKRGRKAKASAEAAPASAEEAQEPAEGLQLFVGCIPNSSYTLLDSYVAERVAEISKSFGTVDPRVTQSNDEPLAFGRWKAILGEACRQTPPTPGAYVAFSYGSELTAAVVDALIPMCSTVVRGVR